MSRGTRRERHGGAVAARRAVRVLGRYTACCLVLAFFSLPLLWLASAPFDRTPGTAVSLPEFTLANFRALWDNPYAVDSLRNSVVLAAGAGALTVVSAALAAYALSRVRLPGRDALLYALLLLSAIIPGLRDGASRARAAAPAETGSGSSAVMRDLRSERYLRRLLGLTLLATLCATLVDYLFKAEVARAVPAGELGSFFGGFNALLSGAALVVQFTIAPRLLARRWRSPE